MGQSDWPAIIYDDSYGPGCNTSVSSLAQADMADCCNTLKGKVIQKPKFCQLPQADWHNLTTCFVARNDSREDGLACVQAPLKDADRRQAQLGWAGIGYGSGVREERARVVDVEEQTQRQQLHAGGLENDLAWRLALQAKTHGLNASSVSQLALFALDESQSFITIIITLAMKSRHGI